jgi:hypothetical protein
MRSKTWTKSTGNSRFKSDPASGGILAPEYWIFRPAAVCLACTPEAVSPPPIPCVKEFRMRFITVGLVASLVASAYIAGRITASPPAAASGLRPMVTTFSHFECYTAKFGMAPGAAVQLTDQFQTYQTKIGPPQFFCTPVAKKLISGHEFQVPPPANHLTCYMIQGPTIQQRRPYANQFVQNDNVVVGTPSLLCLPTHKSG